MDSQQVSGICPSKPLGSVPESLWELSREASGNCATVIALVLHLSPVFEDFLHFPMYKTSELHRVNIIDLDLDLDPTPRAPDISLVMLSWMSGVSTTPVPSSIMTPCS